MNTRPAELFVPGTCQLGEGPFWWEDRLWWVDIDAGHVHSVNTAGGDERILEIGQRIGSAVPAERGNLLVAVEEGIGIFDPNGGQLEILHRPEHSKNGSRFNDGKCDPAGRFAAGTLSMTSRKKSSALYVLEGLHDLKTLLAPVTLSNGLAWSADGSTFYHIDTPAQEIAVYSYDLDRGEIVEKRGSIPVPPEMGWPDGMCIDQADRLWVAHWGGSAVRCWDPRQGTCLREISLPCSQPTSCCFGGRNFETLFITTARQSENVDKHTLAGSIFACKPSAAGFPTVAFRC